MREKGIAALELATATHCSYENVRKMMRGESLPGPTLLTNMCTRLGWKIQEAKNDVTADRFLRQFGDEGWKRAGKDPTMAPLYIVWPYLNEEARSVVKLLVNTFSKENKKKGRGKRGQQTPGDARDRVRRL